MDSKLDKISLAQLAEKLGLGFKGDGELPITSVKDINHLDKESADTEGYIFFIESEKIIKKCAEATLLDKLIVLTSEGLAESFKNAIIFDETKAPRLFFIRLLELFEPKFEVASVDRYIDTTAQIDASSIIMPGAVVMQSAKVGKNCKIYPGAVLEHYTSIGDNTVVYSNAVISRLCKVGSNCIIHANSVVGADGFGFYDAPDGTRYKVPQIGNVEIGDYVEIGACSTIDRATIESTTIGDFTKLDNQVHIAHNCQLGRKIFIAGCTGIAGSTVVEDNCIIGGMTAIADHIRIGKGTVIMSTSAIPKSIAGGIHYGFPARPVKEQHRINSSVSKIPELLHRVRKLESKL